MVMAFFQNLLGSITQMINIYKNLQTAIAKGDLTPVFLEMGKIFRLIIDFQPIEMAGVMTSNPYLRAGSDVIRLRHQVS